MNTTRADDWRSRGGHFAWRPAQEDASSVEIFHVEIGDPRRAGAAAHTWMAHQQHRLV